MTVAGLISKVMVKLEEYTPFAETTLIAAPQSAGLEVKPIRSYISDVLDSAVNEMLKVLPIAIIFPDEMVITEESEDSDILYLDDTFLRLHTFKMHEWEKSVNVAYPEGGEVHELQKCEWTKGRQCKPVVIYGSKSIVNDGTVSKKKYIQYFSVSTDRSIDEAKQVSVFSQSDYSATDDIRNGHLSEFFALNAAKKVYEIFGMSDKSELVTARLEKLIEEFAV